MGSTPQKLRLRVRETDRSRSPTAARANVETAPATKPLGLRLEGISEGVRWSSLLGPTLLLGTLLLHLTVESAIATTASEDLFNKACAPCHGKDGKANTLAGKKAGAKDLSISKTTSSEIEKQITEGKADTKGSIKMPAFAGKITPAEIKALAEYVLAFRKN
jgi:mono/diheme cytochrome c family protein